MDEIKELKLRIKVEKSTPEIISLQLRDQPSESIKLNIRKALNGDYMIFDHPLYDIVLMPKKNKVVTFVKKNPKLDPYPHQDNLFDYLRKKGMIVPDTIQAGNVFGSLEAVYPINDKINTIETLLLVIFKFFEHELEYVKSVLNVEEEYEDEMLDPTEDESTDYGEVAQKTRKGTLNPWYTDYHGLLYRI
jgi:hypothetical protein